MEQASPTSSTPKQPVGRMRSRTFRSIFEGGVRLSLAACASFTVLISTAIIVVLFQETRTFFTLEHEETSEPIVTLSGFLFGTEWSPLLGADRHFGVLPLVSGTLLVTVIAMVVAIPFGLVTAIYLSEYAPARIRAVLKPILEVLAGIPTIVYGFLALTVITPMFQSLTSSFVDTDSVDGWQGIGAYNALGAGIAVGIMCLPIVCSISEDALRAVPNALREAAFGVGGTKFDVSMKVVTPAALSGIVAASLLAIARAVGETMIVALAAGGLAQLTADPSAEVQTMTAYMVQIFLGDVSNFGAEYYSSYAVASTLFLMTFAITILGHIIRVRFRESYE